MNIEVKHPDKENSTAPYSAGVIRDGWLYVSGHGPIDMKTGQIVEGTIEEQTAMTLDNIGKVLKAAGCSRSDVVKTTCHLLDINEFDRFNKVYAGFFSGVRPARTTVQSVLWDDIKVEIDVIAKVPQ